MFMRAGGQERRRISAVITGAFLVVATAVFGAAGQAPAPSPPKGGSYLSPLRLDPYGKQDPLETFEEWRMANKVSLPVVPTVVQAHELWMQVHGLAPSQENQEGQPQEIVPETATAGGNLCPAAGVQDYQGEVAIAVNPNNSQQLVAGANTFYQDSTATCLSPTGGSAQTYGTQALYGSSDGGSTWTYNCAPWPSSLTGGVAAANAWFGSDPAVSWDSSGNAYAVYMLISQNNTNSGAAIVIAESTNAGATWSSLGIIVNYIKSTTVFDDKELMAIDTTSGQLYSHTNRIYVIWDENNVERVAYSDGGTSWTTVVVDSSGGDIGGDLAIGADGTVYAVWNRYSTTGGVGTGDKLMFSKSTNGGVSWTAPAQIAQHNLASFGTNNAPPAQDQRKVNAFPAVAVDTNPSSPYFGTLYIAYCDFPSGVGSGTDLNTYLIKSTDGGGTWSSQLKVNDDTGTTATQFFPWVAVDESSGNVVASWYDTRNYTANNRQTQIFFAYSPNGGASFSPNLLVTQASSQFVNNTTVYSDENSTDNTNYNGNQYGDYAQITASKGTAWPIWTDSRQFYPTSGSNLIEDAATAAVTFSPSVWNAQKGASGYQTATYATPGTDILTKFWIVGASAANSGTLATASVISGNGQASGKVYPFSAWGSAGTAFAAPHPNPNAGQDRTAFLYSVANGGNAQYLVMSTGGDGFNFNYDSITNGTGTNSNICAPVAIPKITSASRVSNAQGADYTVNWTAITNLKGYYDTAPASNLITGIAVYYWNASGSPSTASDYAVTNAKWALASGGPNSRTGYVTFTGSATDPGTATVFLPTAAPNPTYVAFEVLLDGFTPGASGFKSETDFLGAAVELANPTAAGVFAAFGATLRHGEVTAMWRSNVEGGVMAYQVAVAPAAKKRPGAFLPVLTTPPLGDDHAYAVAFPLPERVTTKAFFVKVGALMQDGSVSWSDRVKLRRR